MVFAAGVKPRIENAAIGKGVAAFTVPNLPTAMPENMTMMRQINTSRKKPVGLKINRCR
jgi:hypothetical protein